MNSEEINGVQCFEKKFRTRNSRSDHDLSEVNSVQLHFKRKFTNVKKESHLIVWRKVKDEYGRTYFWNIITNKTTWELPFDTVVRLENDIQSNSLFIHRKKNQVNELQIETMK